MALTALLPHGSAVEAMWQSSRLLDRANLLLAQLVARESEKYRRPPTCRSEAHLFQRFEIGLEILGAIPVHTDFPGHAGISKCVESVPVSQAEAFQDIVGNMQDRSLFPLCGIIDRGRHSRKTETSRRTSNSQIKARMAAKFGSFVKTAQALIKLLLH